MSKEAMGAKRPTDNEVVMKLALEALTATMATHGFREHIEETKDKAIEALEEALANTAQQRNPLTDAQIRQVMQSLGWTGEAPSDIAFARAIEAAHGIKE